MLQRQAFRLYLDVVILEEMRQRDLERARREEPTRAGLCPVAPSRRVGAGGQEMEPVLVARFLPQPVESVHVKSVRVWPQIRGPVDGLAIDSDDCARGESRAD